MPRAPPALPSWGPPGAAARLAFPRPVTPEPAAPAGRAGRAGRAEQRGDPTRDLREPREPLVPARRAEPERSGWAIAGPGCRAGCWATTRRERLRAPRSLRAGLEPRPGWEAGRPLCAGFVIGPGGREERRQP